MLADSDSKTTISLFSHFPPSQTPYPPIRLNQLGGFNACRISRNRCHKKTKKMKK